MFWPFNRGTGNALYEERLGQMERRFLRRCRKIDDWHLRSYARSAAVSAQEMNHWLFLNPSSLFREQLPGLSPDGGRNIFRLWFVLCLAALQVEDSLPGPATADEPFFEALLAEVGMNDPRPVADQLGHYRDNMDNRILYDDLLADVRGWIPIGDDLEQTLTFGFLAARMMEKAAIRCRKMIG